MRERVEDGWDRERYESSVNRFFFVLLSVQGHLKALNYLSFSSLPIFAIRRHWIIFISTRFSAFTSLVLLRLFSTFQPRAVWRKASAQSSITSSNSSVDRLRSPRSKSSLVYIIFRTPTQSLQSHPSSRCTWTRLLFSMPPTQLTRHFRRGNTCILFNLKNRCTFCYAISATYVAFPVGCRPIYFKKQV